MILEFIKNGLLIWPTIEKNGVTRPRKYSELSPTDAIQADCHDVNQKFIRSLPSEWNMYVVVWRNKPDLYSMSMDDLYNNLKEGSSILMGMRLSPLIKPRWNVTIAVRGATLQENVEHQEHKTTRTGRAQEGMCLLKLLTPQLWCVVMVLEVMIRVTKLKKDLTMHLWHTPLQVMILRELRKKLEIVQREKDGIQLTVEKLKNAPNSLNKLIDSQIVDNCKKGLRYNAAPPPPQETCPILEIMKKLMKHMLPLEVTPKEGKSLEKRVPNKNNMYSVDLKNIIPKGGLTFLFAKAISDESRLWHRRLGQLNFKTINKLVMGNLVREAVSIACYVQNRVLVVKPHNKTTYALFHGRTPMLSFMRPFGCPVTILNTIDHLGKFDEKTNEGFFVGYSLNNKAFRIFNNRTTIMEETLHIKFSKNTPNNVGSGPNWLFDIDVLPKIMNYQPVIAGTQYNGNAGTKDNNNASQARKEKEPGKYYILLPLWIADLPFLQEPKSSQDAEFKPSNDVGKKVNEVPRQENECKD
uniref:Ribonuclease H-like domain-containing protein n=1 Tax=Tanacetum cinerariifolium TaxID=118510 RepID=A0A6L2J6E3_TANCI|nr:ribonuclease H-like domain-containing protein [Tanacetum cinerariifolium]